MDEEDGHSRGAQVGMEGPGDTIAGGEEAGEEGLDGEQDQGYGGGGGVR